MVAKLKAVADAKGGGFEERIFVRGDKQEAFERFSLNVRSEEGLLTPQVPK